jgi:hypothetical protein
LELKMKEWICLFLFASLGLLVAPGASAEKTLSDKEAQAIAKDAYVYSYAIMESYQTWRTQAVDKAANGYVGGFNVFRHYSEPFTPDNKDIVTPNNDTPYSWAWLDLRAEPMVVSVPAVPRDRYYVMQWIDLFTQNFAYIGVRSTGFGAGSYMIAGPMWKGEKPKGIKEVFKAETEIVGTLTRTALQGPEDVPNVKAIQAQYRLEPLSAFLNQPAPAAAPAIDFPLYDKAKARTHDFIGYLNFLLQFAEPPVASEIAIRKRFEKIGIGPGRPWDASKVDPATLAAIDAGVKEGQAEIDALAARTFSTNGLFGSRAQLKTNYLQRDVGAMKGLYGNSLEEAWYGGYICDGSKPSSVHFEKANLPPAKFFWSMTMYTIPDRFLYANSLNRYSIGDRTKGLEYGKDGSLTIYVSNASPGKDKESNWLPAPASKCSLVARVYGPSKAAMTGEWKLPPLQPSMAQAEAQSPSASTVPVTVDNFTRAESDLYFGGLLKDSGAIGKFLHRREPARIDNQTVIRLNRDTLYSSAVFDLDAGPVMITLPDAGKRFMSMQVINEDHYVPEVVYGKGSYTLTKDEVGTRYVAVAIRTLVDPANPKDVEQVHVLQDAITVKQKAAGQFEIPGWDQASQKKVRDALLVLGSTIPDFKKAFGTKERVDPVRHLIGTAAAWGGNPDRDATYLNITPARNDGTTSYKLSVKDVPVDAFWSVRVYNAEGYYEKNPYHAYTLNNLTAEKSSGGGIDIQFGGCDGKIPNCLPITKGWNYTVRLYRPRAEILNGKWKFPEPQPAS